MLDVGARLPATGQHQHRLGQHLAPVVQREPLTGDRDPRRQRITQPQPVGKRAKSVQPDMGDDPLARRLPPPPGPCCYRSPRKCPPGSGF